MLLIVVPIDNPSFSYSLIKRSFHLLADLNPINCFHWWPVVTSSFWEVFHKPTTSLFVLLLVFQQLRYNLLGRVLSKLICGRSWHFLLHSVIPMIYLLFFLLEALWCCSFHSIISNCEDRFLFVLIHLTGVLHHLFKFVFIVSGLISLFNRSAVRFWSSLFLVSLVSTTVISLPSCPLYSSFIALQPSSPRNVPCSFFLTDCLQSRSSLLYSFF